jgi:hypothetical protein
LLLLLPATSLPLIPIPLLLLLLLPGGLLLALPWLQGSQIPARLPRCCAECVFCYCCVLAEVLPLCCLLCRLVLCLFVHWACKVLLHLRFVGEACLQQQQQIQASAWNRKG